METLRRLITISAVTGREISRSVGNPAGNAVLNQIAASARLTAAPQQPAPPAPGPRLQFPGTGDGGLLNGR